MTRTMSLWIKPADLQLGSLQRKHWKHVPNIGLTGVYSKLALWLDTWLSMSAIGTIIGGLGSSSSSGSWKLKWKEKVFEREKKNKNTHHVRLTAIWLHLRLTCRPWRKPRDSDRAPECGAQGPTAPGASEWRAKPCRYTPSGCWTDPCPPPQGCLFPSTASPAPLWT